MQRPSHLQPRDLYSPPITAAIVDIKTYNSLLQVETHRYYTSIIGQLCLLKKKKLF